MFRQPLHIQLIGLGLQGLVEDLEGIGVLDEPLAVLPEQLVAIPQDIEPHGHDRHGVVDEDHQHDDHHQAIAEQLGPGHMGLVVGQLVLSGVADQPLRIAHPIHGLVAGIDAGAAVDALVLQAIADVDAGRADLHAEVAVDAVPQPQRLGVGLAATGTAGLAALAVVADDVGVLVEHGGLEAGIGAHVDAHDGAHPAGVAVGTGSEEDHPEDDPAARLQGEEVRHQLEHVLEVGDEGEAGAQRQQDPGQVLGALAGQLLATPGGGIQLAALVGGAFQLLLEPDEHEGPYRLWAEIATPDPAEEGGNEEEGEGGDHEDPGQQGQVLRPDGGTEDVELLMLQIEQNRLAAVVAQQGQSDEEGDEEPAHGLAHPLPVAGLGPDVDAVAGIEPVIARLERVGIEGPGDVLVGHILDIDLVLVGHCNTSLHSYCYEADYILNSLLIVWVKCIYSSSAVAISGNKKGP